jgi:hypothetical protein
MYREKLWVSVNIADIHLGVKAVTAEEFKYQLYERFILPISEMTMLDSIVINGDVAHLALPFNSKIAEVYVWLFASVVAIAKKKNAIVIVIKGTLSHDFDQMDNVKSYANEVEMHFVDHPTVIETRGMRFYGLPDIHVSTREEERQIYNYPDNHFDMVFGHGSLTETQFVKQDSEHSISKNIIYDSKELQRITKGPILFGHIHTYMNIRGQIFYINSFLRFAHAEEIDKGWMIVVYIKETGQYMTERVINDLAFNFNSYEIKHREFEKLEVEDAIKRIDKFIKTWKVDRLSLEINYMVSDANIAKIHMLRTYYSKDKRVNKLKFKALSEKEIEIVEASEQKVDESKKYLIDPSLRFEQKLQRFIEEEYHVRLPLSDLETVLMSDDMLVREGV